jgi:two-component system NarL family response regulator
MYTARQTPTTPAPVPVSVLPSRAIRVLLVDDHAIMREGLASLLERDGRMTVIGQAGGGEEALALFQELQPDVSVVDLRMIPMDGAELTSRIRELDPNARVVMLTTYDTDEEVYRGLRSGAASYLLKDVHFDKLVDTICEVFAGRKSISPEIAAKLAEYVAQEALTARQLEVLKCLARGMSNLEIGSTLYISEGTVKAHIKAILRKLEARDRTQAISIAMKRGLVRSA